MLRSPTVTKVVGDNIAVFVRRFNRIASEFFNSTLYGPKKSFYTGAGWRDQRPAPRRRLVPQFSDRTATIPAIWRIKQAL
jgi:hypothetical protein